MFRHRLTRSRTRALAVTAVAAALVYSAPAPAHADPPAPYVTVWDTFRGPFTTDSPSAKWFHFAAGPYVGNDAKVTTGPHGLRAVSSGKNRRTGHPAFVRTTGQEHTTGGLPGGLDHVKWLVYMNHQASSGVPGFDAVRGQTLTCNAVLGARMFGAGGNPFGIPAWQANRDLRLASAALNTIDFESFMVFDIFFTNKRIFALYERLPFGRTPSNNYAAFTYMIDIGPNEPGQLHQAAIAYDRARGVVRWILDGRQVFQVDRIGHRINRRTMTIDHGGTEQRVRPRQLACGMGHFTLLDGHLPTRGGLVRLSDAPGFYFHPPTGAPRPQTFLDEQSRLRSRLFGQGAELRAQIYTVSSTPS